MGDMEGCGLTRQAGGGVAGVEGDCGEPIIAKLACASCGSENRWGRYLNLQWCRSPRILGDCL